MEATDGTRRNHHRLMMGRSHALSGAVGWLGLCAAAGPVAGIHPSWVQVTGGAVVASAAALLPDVDHPRSTVSRSLGPLTRAAGRIVSYLADRVRDASCGCCATESTRGHRTLTHTAVFAVAVGVAVSLSARRWGTPAASIVVGVAAGLAVLGLMARRGVWLTAALLGVAAAVAVTAYGGGVDWWWLGVPAGWGVLAHAIGDGLTERGVPLLWPLRISGCRWRDLGLPRFLRFRTGGQVEALLGYAMAAGGIVAGWVLIAG